jgi:hypothetical protein
VQRGTAAAAAAGGQIGSAAQIMSFRPVNKVLEPAFQVGLLLTPLPPLPGESSGDPSAPPSFKVSLLLRCPPPISPIGVVPQPTQSEVSGGRRSWAGKLL